MFLTNLSRLCGLLSPVSGVLFVWLAIAHAPWFRFTEHDLSMLGVNGWASGFFNWGLGLTGLLSLAYAAGCARQWSRLLLLQRFAILSLALGSIGLALVGFVPRTYSLPHKIASGVFFIFIPLAIFMMALASFKSARRSWGIFGLAIAALMVGLKLAPWPWTGASISQLLASLPWWVWMAAMAVRRNQ